jgi:hypothetical protein
MALLEFVSSSKAKAHTLILSQRNIIYQAANSCLYDAEDLICEVEGADLIAPKPSVFISRKLSRGRELLSRAIEIERAIELLARQFDLEQEYDLLFLSLDNPWEAITINSIKNWRKKFGKIACYIGEIWDKEVDNWRIIKDLKKFDCIFVSVNHCIEKLAKLTGKPCIYLPPAVNTLQFCPYPNAVERSVDIAYVGRHSPITHQSILDYASKKISSITTTRH